MLCKTFFPRTVPLCCLSIVEQYLHKLCFATVKGFKTPRQFLTMDVGGLGWPFGPTHRFRFVSSWTFGVTIRFRVVSVCFGYE